MTSTDSSPPAAPVYCRREQIGRATLYLADARHLLPALPQVDACITDPPYASGGMYRSDRIAEPASKYVQSGQRLSWRSFAGDAKDQRSWVNWCVDWLQMLPLRDGAYVMSFIDWRQLPALTDAFQWAGLTWRGVAPWDKGLGSRAPHKGYLRHQCEYIVWGTAGACANRDDDGPFPGAYRWPVIAREKHHMTGKPVNLMRDLVRVVPQGGTILDPFMGSGTTGVAACALGRNFIGIECDEVHFETACRRIREAQLEPA